MNTLSKISTGLLLFMTISSAVAVVITPPGGEPIAGETASALGDIISRVFGFLFWIIMMLSVLFFLIGAFFYLTSAGSEEKTKKAKNYLVYAAIGIVLALLSNLLPRLISSVLRTGGGV